MAIEPALTAQQLIAAAGYELAVSSSVVLAMDPSLVPTRARLQRSRRQHHPFRAVTRLVDGVDLVVAAGPGAAVSAITVELLHAFGVRRVVAVGTAGLLHHDGRPPERLRHVVGRAESDEATSAHYGGHHRPDGGLTDMLVTEFGGPPVVALTTDVPFRHTPDRLAQHRARADVIEMEAASLFAAAKHCEIKAGAVVVSSDGFIGDRWEILNHDPSPTLATTATRSAELLAASQ